jgi:N-acetylglucosamine repressor
MTLLSPEASLDDARTRFLRAVLRDNMREGPKNGHGRSLTLLEAAEIANLSRPSVQQFYQSLRDAGVALRDRVEIKDDAGYVLGVDLRDTHPVRVVLCNAHGMQQGEVWAPATPADDEKTADKGPTASALLDLAHEGIMACAARERRSSADLIGIGISLPGPVVDGFAVGSEASPWDLIRADQGLERRLGPWLSGADPEIIVTRSDAYASAVMEHLWGAPEAAAANTIYVKWSVDLRASIIVNGELYTGHKGTAGELGHIQTEAPPSVIPCLVCGHRQCLHAIASLQHLSEIAYPPRSGDEAAMSRFLVPAEDVVMRAREDRRTLEALKVAAHWIGIAVASYVAALDPATVVLGGAIGSRAFDLVQEDFKQPIAERVPSNSPDIEIVGAEISQHTATLGVAACALLERGPAYLRKKMVS